MKGVITITNEAFYDNIKPPVINWLDREYLWKPRIDWLEVFRLAKEVGFDNLSDFRIECDITESRWAHATTGTGLGLYVGELMRICEVLNVSPEDLIRI